MDKAIEQIFKAFSHLAREVQVYFISGTLILLNAYVIDLFYNCGSLWRHVKHQPYTIPVIILAYVLGHISMAFYYVLIDLTGLSKQIECLCNKVPDKERKCVYKKEIETYEETLPSLYKNHSGSPDVYLQFIERNHILSHMRWTISAAMFINFIADLVLLLKSFFDCQSPLYWQILLLTIINLFCAAIMLLLSYSSERTYKDYIDCFKYLPVNINKHTCRCAVSPENTVSSGSGAA